jgi:hypothetical protein
MLLLSPEVQLQVKAASPNPTCPNFGDELTCMYCEHVCLRKPKLENGNSLRQSSSHAFVRGSLKKEDGIKVVEHQNDGSINSWKKTKQSDSCLPFIHLRNTYKECLRLQKMKKLIKN